METNSIQKELLLTSYLFEYPSKEWWGDVKECAAEAHTVARPQSREVLEEFFDYVEESDPKEYEDAYVRAFDFSQNTNLYLTTHNRTDFGKQSEEMLAYKQLFLDAGYDLDHELPDYLPVVLELSARSGDEIAQTLLSSHREGIEVLRSALVDAGSPYAHLVEAISMTLPEIDAATADRVRALVAAGPPTETVGVTDMLPFPSTPISSLSPIGPLNTATAADAATTAAGGPIDPAGPAEVAEASDVSEPARTASRPEPRAASQESRS